MIAPRGLRRAALRSLGGALLGASLTGCWGAQFVRMPSYTEETRAEVVDLTARNEELLKRLVALEAQLSEQTELLRSLRAESATGLVSMRDRLEILEQEIGSSGGEGRPRPRAVATREGAAAPDTADAAVAPDSRAQYDKAYLELLKGNHDLAAAGFQAYVAQNPESDLADNAQYWIGECHDARGETALAVEAFEAVESRWPGSDKIPDALFKIAGCHQTEHHNGAARRAYQDLIARFPNSEKAQLARDRLALLPAGE